MGKITHGESHNTKTRLYRIWQGIKTRTTNKKHEYYKYYGGRGISVCKEWNSFETFRDWANSNGYANNLTIERKNNNGNYEPNNCEFITQCQNNQNKNRKPNWGIYVTPWGYRITIRRSGKTHNGGSTTDMHTAIILRDILDNKLNQRLPGTPGLPHNSN